MDCPQALQGLSFTSRCLDAFPSKAPLTGAHPQVGFSHISFIVYKTKSYVSICCRLDVESYWMIQAWHYDMWKACKMHENSTCQWEFLGDCVHIPNLPRAYPCNSDRKNNIYLTDCKKNLGHHYQPPAPPSLLPRLVLLLISTLRFSLPLQVCECVCGCCTSVDIGVGGGGSWVARGDGWSFTLTSTS